MREGGDVTQDCFTSDLLLRGIHGVKRHKSCLLTMAGNRASSGVDRKFKVDEN